MRILAIDYGRKKIGLAIADSILAEPLKVIKYQLINKPIKEIIDVIKKEKVEKVVVGVSEGKMGAESKKFSQELRKNLKIRVETFDETLTTHDAQELSRNAGIKRTKRKALEDAYAAALMLQNYLDSDSFV